MILPVRNPIIVPPNLIPQIQYFLDVTIFCWLLAIVVHAVIIISTLLFWEWFIHER